jgi:hypothetical protein
MCDLVHSVSSANFRGGDNTGRLLWLTDHSEQSMQQDFKNLPTLKVQEREEAAWAIRNWRCGLNLRGWATAFGLGVRSITYFRLLSHTKLLS